MPEPFPVSAPGPLGWGARHGAHVLYDRARKPAWIATYGALTGLSALAALFLGVLLAG